jgi:hypothetical protein
MEIKKEKQKETTKNKRNIHWIEGRKGKRNKIMPIM